MNKATSDINDGVEKRSATLQLYYEMLLDIQQQWVRLPCCFLTSIFVKSVRGML